MEYYHLTTPQQNIWNLQKYYSDMPVANLCGAIFFHEKRDGAVLKEAICQFIRCQQGIRLRFCEGKEPMQYVSDEIDEAIPVLTFHSKTELEDFAEDFAKEPIGLLERQMYRFVVFHLAKEDGSGVLVVLSHLISDAWTFGLMANHVDTEYRRLLGETDSCIPKGDYRDFIQSEDQYLVSERYKKDKIYWDGKYEACPAKSPINGHSRITNSIKAKRTVRTLPLSLEQGIAAYCKHHPVTEAVLFETALAIYLFHITPDIPAITMGVPVLNRSNAKEKEIAGMFTSTMPLTLELTMDMEVLELAGKITKEHMNLFRHQKYPFSEILRGLREKQGFSGNLYDVMISYQNAKTKTGAKTRWYSNGCSEAPLLIHIDNRDGKECHTIHIDYQTAAFGDEEEVELLIDRLEYILRQIVEEERQQVSEIEMIPRREFDQVVYGFNDTYIEDPRERCIHELFQAQAAKTPDRAALIFEDKRYTYRQVNELSNSLALFLRENGVKRGDRVVVLLKRDERVILTQLAVLKLGAVFIPIDNRYPQERIAYILLESHAKILVKNRDSCVKCPVECEIEEWERLPAEKIDCVGGAAGEPCYVIFTSGSTGRPKGCMLTNRGLTNFCRNNNILEKCNLLEKQVCASVNTISFDFFIAESLLPLVNGYTVALANEEESMNQKLFVEFVIRNQVNIIQTTPTRYKLFFADHDNLSFAWQLRVIVTSGEALPLELLKCFVEHTDAAVFNPLGPSECSVWATGGELHSLDSSVSMQDITIGKPIANTQAYILDNKAHPVPIGVPGELCIAGDGVGRGYLNRPELTAERFVENPFANKGNHHGRVMYHTGDLVRWRTNGEIEYLGRIDTQVKIRGLRIELGEIENVMSGMEGISLAAVVDRQDQNGRKYLVGYYTAEGSVNEKGLRRYLSAKLPTYMVPNYFMRLDAMPMTASGKIDRKNLPIPDFTLPAQDYAAPETDTEKRLAEIWQKILQVQQVGKWDNFFEMGGDSLLAISMLSEIEQNFQIEITVAEIMEQPELGQLAKCIDHAHREVSPIVPRHASQYALLPQQKAIYATCRKEPDSLTYNMPVKIPLPDTINRERLKRSIVQVLEHHRLLRSCFKENGAGVWGIYVENAQIVFENYENGNEDTFIRPFDLGKAPLVRAGFTGNALLLDMHHILRTAFR